MIRSEPIEGFPGEVPTLLRSAYEVAEQNGLSLKALAAELRITLPRLRLLLGEGGHTPYLAPGLTRFDPPIFIDGTSPPRSR